MKIASEGLRSVGFEAPAPLPPEVGSPLSGWAFSCIQFRSRGRTHGILVGAVGAICRLSLCAAYLQYLWHILDVQKDTIAFFFYFVHFHGHQKCYARPRVSKFPPCTLSSSLSSSLPYVFFLSFFLSSFFSLLLYLLLSMILFHLLLSIELFFFISLISSLHSFLFSHLLLASRRQSPILASSSGWQDVSLGRHGSSRNSATLVLWLNKWHNKEVNRREVCREICREICIDCIDMWERQSKMFDEPFDMLCRICLEQVKHLNVLCMWLVKTGWLSNFKYHDLRVCMISEVRPITHHFRLYDGQIADGVSCLTKPRAKLAFPFWSWRNLAGDSGSFKGEGWTLVDYILFLGFLDIESILKAYLFAAFLCFPSIWPLVAGIYKHAARMSVLPPPVEGGHILTLCEVTETWCNQWVHSWGLEYVGMQSPNLFQWSNALHFGAFFSTVVWWNLSLIRSRSQEKDIEMRQTQGTLPSKWRILRQTH